MPEEPAETWGRIANAPMLEAEGGECRRQQRQPKEMFVHALTKDVQAILCGNEVSGVTERRGRHQWPFIIHVCNFAGDLCHRMSKSTPQLPHFGKQMLQVKKDSDLDSRLRQVVHDDD